MDVVQCAAPSAIMPFTSPRPALPLTDLQYKNVRPDYLNAIWSIVNWSDVAARVAAAK